MATYENPGDLSADLDYAETEAPDNVQFKFWDAQLLNSNITTIGLSWNAINSDPAVYLSLFTPPLGNSWNSRIGSRVMVYGLVFKGHVESAAFSSTNPDTTSRSVRVVLYQNKHTDGLAALGGEVFDSFHAVNAFYCYRNPLYLSKHKVLYDKIMCFDFPTSAYHYTTGDWHFNAVSRYFEFCHYFEKPLMVQFNNDISPTTNSSIVNNSFHVMAARDNSGISFAVSYYSRFLYTDV